MCVKIRMKFRNWRELNRDTVLSVICAPSSLFSSIHLHALFAETRWEIAAPLLRSCRPRHFLEQPLRWQERGRQSGRRGRRPGGRWRRRRRVRTRPVLRGGRGRAADRRHRAGTERAGCASRGRHLAERAPHPPHPPHPAHPAYPAHAAHAAYAAYAAADPWPRTDGAGPGRGEAGAGRRDAPRSAKRSRRGCFRVTQEGWRRARRWGSSRPHPRARGRDARTALQVSHLHGELMNRRLWREISELPFVRETLRYYLVWNSNDFLTWLYVFFFNVATVRATAIDVQEFSARKVNVIFL